MNKILNINLGGYPFTMDDNAYELLSRYLGSIHRHFKSSNSYQEITGDIESRLAEIFTEKIGARQIVTISEVEAAIGIMGKPEDFGAESIDSQGANTSYERFKSEYRTGKRLFRDDDDKVVGGVCSGIAAYFGISDPLWVRVGFAIAMFVLGFGFLFYFLLLIIVPKAETAADRLSMRGEPINVENIAKIVEEEFNEISGRINNYGKPNGEKKNNFRSADPIRNAASNGFSFIGELISNLIKAVTMLIKPFVFILGIIAFIILACLWIAFGAGFTYGYPFAGFLFGSSKFLSTLAAVNVFFVIGLALLGVALLIARVFFKYKINNTWSLGIGIFWALNSICLGFVFATIGSEFNRESRVSQEIFNNAIPSDTLIIELEADRISEAKINFGKIKVDGDRLIDEIINMQVVKSNTNDFRLVKEVKSHGKNIEEAEVLAAAVEYKPRIEGNKLILPESFVLTNTKFRGQHVEMRLYVPDGKFLRIGKGVGRIVHFDYDHDSHGHWDIEGYTWQMKNSEMMSSELYSKNNFEKKFDLRDFEKINIEGSAKIQIRQGDNYEISIIGRENLVKNIEVSKVSNMLEIDTKNDDNDSDDIKIVITMPKLLLLDADRTGDIDIKGFDQDEMTMNLNGNFELKADIMVKNLKLDAESTKIRLEGKADNLEILLDNDANADARRFTVKTATVSLRNGTEADIYATEKVMNRRDEGNLNVEGGAITENPDKEKK